MHEVKVRHKGKPGIFSTALIDEDDNWIACRSWFMKKGYPHTRVYSSKHSSKRRDVSMHRMILGEQNLIGLEVDHIDRNPLNNQRSNLRAVTKEQNCQNLNPQRRSKTGVRGVTQTEAGHYKAVCRIDGKTHHLGTFQTLRVAERVVKEFRSEFMPYSQEGGEAHAISTA